MNGMIGRIRSNVVSIAKSPGIGAGIVALIVAFTPVSAQQTLLRVPTSVLQRYEGEWVYPDGEKINVRVHGETLYREADGQQVPFIPVTETLFRLGPVFTAEFILDKDGGATQLLTDGIVEYRLRRTGSKPAASAAPPPAVRIPKSVLEQYVGLYEYIPGQMKRTDLRVIVSMKGDTLFRDVGESNDPLIPISATRFRVGNTSQITEFVVDEAGVTQIMGRGFQQMLTRLKTKR
jgi:hypothetical protein